MDLVQGSHQLGWFHGDIHQPGVAVSRWVFIAERHPLSHFLKDSELHLQEFDGTAFHGQL